MRVDAFEVNPLFLGLRSAPSDAHPAIPAGTPSARRSFHRYGDARTRRPGSGPRKDDIRAPPPERAEDGPAARRDERAGPAGRFAVRPYRRGDRVRRRAGHERLRLLQLRQDRAAAPCTRARSPSPRRPALYRIVRELARTARQPDAAALHQPDRRAERLRHRPQPAPRRRLRHHRPARAPRRARAARRPRPRAQPRLQPRHPHLVGRGRARQHDRLPGEHGDVRGPVRRLGRRPAQPDRRAADRAPRPDRRRASCRWRSAGRASSRPTRAAPR